MHWTTIFQIVLFVIMFAILFGKDIAKRFIVKNRSFGRIGWNYRHGNYDVVVKKNIFKFHVFATCTNEDLEVGTIVRIEGNEKEGYTIKEWLTKEENGQYFSTDDKADERNSDNND